MISLYSPNIVVTEGFEPGTFRKLVCIHCTMKSNDMTSLMKRIQVGQDSSSSAPHFGHCSALCPSQQLSLDQATWLLLRHIFFCPLFYS